MRISILTLFPELFENFFATSIVGRACREGTVSYDLVQIRDFAHDVHRTVDDKPFGGGAGMVMKCQPAFDAINSVRTDDSHIVLLSAKGVPYTQKKAHELAKKSHLIFLCGHYEGVDERIVQRCDEEISIGDYVLTGGELGAMVITDSVVRLIPGVIRSDSICEESYENGLLEYPQYTHPADYQGDPVPEVLLSGHHENIRKWRLQQSLLTTRRVRPDLFEAHELTNEEKKLLEAADHRE